MAMLILQEVIDFVWVDSQTYIELMPARERDCTSAKASCWIARPATYGSVV